MASVGLDVGVMWRLSEDLNVARRLAVHVQQQQHSHRSVASSMIYNGNREFSAVFLTRLSENILGIGVTKPRYNSMGVVLLPVCEVARPPGRQTDSNVSR